MCVCVCVCVCAFVGVMSMPGDQLLDLPIRSRLSPLDHFILAAASLATCEGSVLKPKHTRPLTHQTEISPHVKRGRWGISNTQVSTGRLA